MKNVTVYTKDNCKWCVLVKELLRSEDVPFAELNIDDDLDAALEASRRQFKTMPQVIVDGINLIGGYEATLAYMQSLSYPCTGFGPSGKE